MADNFFAYNRNIPSGFRLGRGVEALDQALEDLVDERDAMTQMINGDGSDPSHYNQHVTAYGFDSTTDARNAYLELDSLVSKLTSNGSQSSVFDAIKQFLARFDS